MVVLAQDEARGLKHDYIGTEHLLLGVLREEEGVGAETLALLGLRADDVRAHVTSIVGEGDGTPTGQIPFTPRAKKVLELSLREAMSLGNNYIGTEHILLGLARENEGVAARILLEYDADAERVRNETLRLLGEARTQPRPRPAPPRPPRRWEYHVLAWPPPSLGDHHEVLNALGDEGWELVTHSDSGQLLFKRPKSD